MAPRGYTTTDAVAAYLGQTGGTLVTQYADRLTPLLGMVEDYIDRMTNRAWLMPAQTGERHSLSEPWLFLSYTPVISVARVQVRTTQVGYTPITLTAGTDYELLNAAIGEIRFEGWSGQHSIALVDYTPNATAIPGDITEAATQIVGHSLTLALNPDRLGVQRLRIGEVSMTYETSGSLCIPQTALDILMDYRRPVIA